MKVIAGYRYLKILLKTSISQIILVEKYGIKYVLKMAKHREYNPIIEREFILLRYLFPLGFVPKPIAIGMIGKRLYFIREWMYGITLGDFLKDKSQDIITEYFKETLYILYRIHTHGIILRDISPDNFLVTRDGRLHLLDAGLAILYKEKPALEGTPHYLAPESILQATYSFKTDIYSVGIMFYQFYTKKLPYDAPHIDALLTQQRRGLPPMLNIPSLPRKLISRILSFDEQERPTTLEAIRMLNESPRIGQLLLDKSFPMIFSSAIDKIVDTIQEKDVRILNVFHARYPEGFFSYIFRELELRLQLDEYKIAINSHKPSASIIIYSSLCSENQVELPKLLNSIQDNQKLIIFSMKPVKLNDLTVTYLNLSIREFLLKEWIEKILSISFRPSDAYQSLPLYAQLNLEILKNILPENFPININVLQTLSDYLYSEFHDLIDLLASFAFAVPKDLIYTVLFNTETEAYAKFKQNTHTSLLLLLELMGFIETTDSHIILLPSFNLLLRRKNMGRLSRYSPITKNIYDELEHILREAHHTEDLPAKIKKLLQEKRIPPTHARIFLDRLYEIIQTPTMKMKLLETKISLGFWKSSIEDWQKLSLEIPEKYPSLLLDYIRLSISLGRYSEAVGMLEDIEAPHSTPLLLYAHALYSNFDEMEKVMQRKEVYTENPYYHLAIGLFELIRNRNTTLAKNHAVRASELATTNPHATMVATYLYGISMLESGNTEAAINILESITGHEEYGIEALLVNFQLGYIYYRRNEYLKAIYYFEYSYYMARELNNSPLSAQAAFYLSHMYYENDRLDLAESYMDFAYKYSAFLSGGQKRHLLRTYVKLAVDLHHYQKALDFLEKHPETEKLYDFITLARLYHATGKIEKLKSLKKRAKSKEEKDIINLLLVMLDKNKKNREVHHD